MCAPAKMATWKEATASSTLLKSPLQSKITFQETPKEWRWLAKISPNPTCSLFFTTFTAAWQSIGIPRTILTGWPWWIFWFVFLRTCRESSTKNFLYCWNSSWMSWPLPQTYNNLPKNSFKQYCKRSQWHSCTMRRWPSCTSNKTTKLWWLSRAGSCTWIASKRTSNFGATSSACPPS